MPIIFRYRILACLIVAYCFTACVHSSIHVKAKLDSISLPPKVDKQGLADTGEYIDWNSIKINGVAHTVGLKNVLYHTLGKPDSIVIPNSANDCEASFFNRNYKYVYIKGSEFELSGDSIVVSTLNFKGSGLKLMANKLTLDSNTTLAVLSKIFPIAAKQQYETIIENNKKRATIILGTNKTYNVGDTDDVWLLFFEKGKLVEIDHHYDC